MVNYRHVSVLGVMTKIIEEKKHVYEQFEKYSKNYLMSCSQFLGLYISPRLVNYI